jgi:hypothetical protein
MPEVRQYRRFGARYMLANILSMVPFVPVFVFICLRASSGNFDSWFWLATGFFILGALFGLRWQAYRSRRMICPHCGDLILRTNHPAPNQPINFICSRCDVEWVSGLSVADD